MSLFTDLRMALAFFRLIRRFRRTGEGGTLTLTVNDAEDDRVSRDA
jgi:hypothetical protein